VENFFHVEKIAARSRIDRFRVDYRSVDSYARRLGAALSRAREMKNRSLLMDAFAKSARDRRRLKSDLKEPSAAIHVS